jgi:NNP family nitrate/nitrite transporter-like MFS transporter
LQLRAEQERIFSLRDFFRAGHLPTLVASLLHFETSFMIWVLMGGLAVLIAADLGLSPAEKGFLVGVPLLGGALSRVPIGLLSDRYGARRVGTITMLALLIPLGLAWQVADDFPRLILVGLLLGVAGSSFAVALPLAGSWYPPRFQGTAMGIAAAGNSGTVLASLFAPRLAESVGWHGVFGLAMIPVILVALVFMTVARSAPARIGLEHRGTAWALLREGDLWWLSLLYSVTFGGYAGFSTFLAIFFKDQYDLSAVAAGGLVAVCAIAGSLARPFGGAWSDRCGGMRVLTAVFAVAPLTLLAPMVGAPLPLTVASLIVGMAWLGLGNGAVFQLVPTRFAGQTGLATGFAGAAGGLGGFLLPALMGIQREMTGSYGPGFFIFALILANMFLCVRALEVGWRFTWLSPTGTRTSPAMDA